METTFLLLVAAAILLPATLLWWIFRSFRTAIRLVATLIGAQLLVIPFFFSIARVESIGHDPDAMNAVWIYATIAVVVGLILFALLERAAQKDS